MSLKWIYISCRGSRASRPPLISAAALAPMDNEMEGLLAASFVCVVGQWWAVVVLGGALFLRLYLTL